MSCPSCIVALSGTDSMESITNKLGPSGIMLAAGAAGALLGYIFVPSKTVGALIGAGVGAGAGWLVTRQSKGTPVPASSQPSKDVPAALPPLPQKASTVAAARVAPVLTTQTPSSSAVVRLTAPAPAPALMTPKLTVAPASASTSTTSQIYLPFAPPLQQLKCWSR